MSAPRTVTIRTCDYGPVTIAEPAWCTGEEHPDGCYRIDITHTSRDMPISVPTPIGPAVLLNPSFEQRPFVSDGRDTGVFLSVEIDGEPYACQPSDLHAIATTLAGHAAGRLRDLARRLAAEQGGQ